MAHSPFRRVGAAALALSMTAGPAAALDLPFGFDLGGGRDRARIAEPAAPAGGDAPVRFAQSGDGVRVSQMEEEMRRLTGKVEELSFLVLQLQEQLRKTQEDNEFRFQDLEGAGATGSMAAAPERRTQTAVPPAPSGSGDEAFAGASADPAPAAPGTLPLPPAGSGTLASSSPATTDEIGAILDTTSLGDLSSAAPGAAAPSGQSQSVASISPNGPVEMYSLAYNYLLAGDYQLAENTFRQYSQAYPTSEDAPDAQYWLGESLFAQAKYRDAAEVFLNAQKTHPQSGKAPEMMLKLGMSLARLDNRETACVTYAEVSKRYPGMSANVKRKLEAEEGSANCG